MIMPRIDTFRLFRAASLLAVLPLVLNFNVLLTYGWYDDAAIYYSSDHDAQTLTDTNERLGIDNMHQSIQKNMQTNVTAIPMKEVVGPVPSDFSPKQKQPCLSAALVLFGVPKSFEYVWKAYLKNIVQRNPHVSFHAHMHMYSDLHQQGFTNIRNNERNITLETPDDILDILDTGGVPTTLVSSSQSEFDKSELTWMHIGDRAFFPKTNLTLDSLKNIFRQGNSMKRAYLSASNQTHLAVNITNQEDIGQPQNLTRTNVEGGNHAQQSRFDIYIFVRSDTLLLSPIDIPCSGLGDREIQIPPMNWRDHALPNEINDRFAVAGPTAANIYAAAKSNVFKEMVLDRRITKGSNNADNLSWAAKENVGQLQTPEKMLKLWLEDAGNHLDVVRVPKQWAQLLRVRAGGRIAYADRKRFGIVEQLHVWNVKLRDHDAALKP